MIHSSRIVITLGVLVIFLLPIPLLAAHKLLLFALASVGLFFWSLKYTKPFLLPRSSLLIMFSALLGMLSFNWAAIGSLVWYPSLVLLGLTLWSIVIANLLPLVIQNHEVITKRISHVLVLICSSFLFLGILNGVPHFARYLSLGNANYQLSLSSLLITPVLFDVSRRMNIVAVGILLLIMGLAVKWDSLGCLITAGSILLCFLSYRLSRINRWFSVITFIIPVFVFFVLPDSSFSGSHIDRWLAIKASMGLFLENPLLGVGMDNWIFAVFDFWPKEIQGITLNMNQVDNHSYPSKILCEIGLVGFILYYGFWSMLLINAFKYRNGLNYLD